MPHPSTPRKIVTPKSLQSTVQRDPQTLYWFSRMLASDHLSGIFISLPTMIAIIIKYYKNKNFCFYRIEMFLFGFEIILIFILTKSACVLSKQIIAINVEKALKYK